MTTLENCTILDLPKICDPRGNLSIIESGINIPFDIKRVFYIYDVPTGQDRGAHAHKTLHEFLICLSGGFDVELDDGFSKKTVRLNRPWKGLHIPPLIWACEINFDPGSVCLVLTSDFYDANDYLRDYQDFLSVKGR
jgi:hypothetical protein